MVKKVLFCNNLLSGLLDFRGNVIRHFLDKGLEVVVVYIAANDTEALKKLPEGVKHYAVQVSRTSRNPLNDLRFMRELMKIMRRERPDYVFNYTIKPNIYGALAAWLNRIPCTDMMAGLGYAFTNNSLSSKIARALYRFALRHCRHLLLLNEANVETVKRMRICKAEKIILLRGGEGVDLAHYAFSDNTSDDTVFLFIARLIEEKGYGDFVKAAEKVKQSFPQARFQVIGSYDLGYPKAIGKAQVERDVAAGTIEYLGVTSDMRAYYSRPGYVICIPSYYSEGLNRSLMEGCATGNPIITTDHPGCRETVEDGLNGYLVPVRQPDQLALAMRKYLLCSADEKAEMSRNSRRLAEKRFGVAEVIRVYDEIIAALR